MKYSKPNPTQTHFYTINPDYINVQTAETYLGLMTLTTSVVSFCYYFYGPIAELILRYLIWL